ncbi:hypothetical protein C7Y71_001370 [Pseudoprevotella muciniphila]|uniref:Uncharacterized protein n=1 Tax=Pseudoprevotella muciniphila TaxID=2133944 RepID=A0A5P8E4F7_9BACT|nr:hypothetical protein [Pseudoprevotella muciniphila]QFQ11778.1 hypothetical protein C7Y71_001370 [Pseudoprevotella muciniphila]
MNIYARYFDQDVLVHNIDELVDFLNSIPDITVTQQLYDEINAYIESEMPYPKRYKIRPRVYFILIKTTAETMEEFKAYNKKSATPLHDVEEMHTKKDTRQNQLTEDIQGWYFCLMTFKRVIQIPETQKFQYQDTRFSAFVKGRSGQDCYDKMVAHLKNRQDIDLRSQFPSSRGNNYSFDYVGEVITPEDVESVKSMF